MGRDALVNRDTSDWTDEDWIIAQKVVDAIHSHRFVDVTVRVRHSEAAKVDTRIVALELSISELVCDLRR